MIWIALKDMIPSWAWKLLASVVVAFVVFKLIEQRGAAKAVAQVEKATHARIDKAKRAADAVATDGAADRLRREYCPACR